MLAKLEGIALKNGVHWSEAAGSRLAGYGPAM